MEEKKQQFKWEVRYSLDISEIDKQHQEIFAIVNKLIEALSSQMTAEYLNGIVADLLACKKNHFATEEKYFKEFAFEGAAEHIEEHAKMNERLEDIQERCGDNVPMLAFEVVDFLEDWIINHMEAVDQKYKECFKAHGMK